MIYLGMTLFLLALTIGWCLTLFGLPGNWLMVLSAVVYGFFTQGIEPWGIGWWFVAGLVVVALLGELCEVAAGMLGAARHGGSKRGAFLALLGSLAGSVLGAVVGLPIPVIGSAVGAVLCAAVGALAGAIVGEAWKGRSWDKSWQIGHAAFWGRLLGTLAKTMIASVMVVAGLAALFV